MFNDIFGQSAKRENEQLRFRVSLLERELKSLKSKDVSYLDQYYDERDYGRARAEERTIVLNRLSCALSSAVLTALGYNKKDKDYINLLRSVECKDLSNSSENCDDDEILKKANEIRSEALDAYGLYDYAKIFLPSPKEGHIAVERMDPNDRAAYYKKLDGALGLDDRLKYEKEGLYWLHHSLEEADGSKVKIGPVYYSNGREIDYTGELASKKLEEMEKELVRLQSDIDKKKSTASNHS